MQQNVLFLHQNAPAPSTRLAARLRLGELRTFSSTKGERRENACHSLVRIVEERQVEQ